MKKFAFLFLVFLVGHSAFSQDLILTQVGDSLNCKIKKVLPTSISFVYSQDGEVQRRIMPRNEIKLFQYNFYPIDYASGNSSGQENFSENAFPTWRLGVGGGLGYRTQPIGNVSPLQAEFLQGLKLGTSLSASASYFVVENIGFGVTHHSFFASSKMENVQVSMPNGTVYEGTVAENTYTHYTGANFTSRVISDSSPNFFYLSLGLGFLGHTDEANFGEKTTIRGNTIGFSADLGYDFPIADSFSMGIQVTALMGALKKVEITTPTGRSTGNLNKEENIGRIDITIGLRFTK